MWRRLAGSTLLLAGHSGKVGADVGDESTESCTVAKPLRIPSMIRPERQTSAVVVRRTDELGGGTNGCLDLRCCAFPIGGQVRIGRLSAGVGRRDPLTFRKVSLIDGINEVGVSTAAPMQHSALE